MRNILRYNNKNWKLPIIDYLCFTANAANSTIQLTQIGTPTIPDDYEYSYDRETWQTYTVGDTITLANIGDKLYMRGNNPSVGVSDAIHKRFVMSGNIILSGDPRTLLNKNNPDSVVSLPDRCFVHIFINCTAITSAENYKLNALTLGTGAYLNMFKNCSGLVTGPKTIEALNIGLASCGQMFQNCTNLTAAPVLKAKVLGEQSYITMFYGCKKLNRVTSYAQNISATQCTANWLGSVSSTGDFYNLGGATYTRNANGIPANWTVHTSL